MSENCKPSPVIYEIYARSFCDSNADGVGDIKGIIAKLDYLASLGVDMVWITPVNSSPMKDFGYDVSDYYNIDPLFGTLDDFRELVKKAKMAGIRIMMDLVISHTSSEHEWFKKSKQSPDNDKSDWYVWADAAEDGTPPNNWLSVFGGSAWQWDSTRQQYYLHNFLSGQPDLNLHNEAVQNELLKIFEFWASLGVSGFRLDTVNFYFHDQKLRNNPALAVESRNTNIAPLVNPYNFQQHLHSKNQPENVDFLKRLRQTADRLGDVLLMGEIGEAQHGLEMLEEYTAGDKKLHMSYAFDLLSAVHFSAREFADVLDRYIATVPTGCAAWAFSNHDAGHFVSRWNLNPVMCRLYLALLAQLPGPVCVYQGDELGLPDCDVPFERLQDPYGKVFYPEYVGRDGCRTPFPWDGTKAHAAFSEAEPWLPVCDEHKRLAVNVQDAANDSTLAHFRRILKFRSGNIDIFSGKLTTAVAEGNLLTLTIAGATRSVQCFYNFSDEDLELPDKQASGEVLLSSKDDVGKQDVPSHLPAWGFLTCAI